MKSRFYQFLIDAAVALSLGGAFLAVVGVDGLLNWLKALDQTAPTTVEAATPKVIQKAVARPLRLAVTRPYKENIFGKASETWDEIGILLNSLGEGYRRYDLIEEKDLQDLAKLKNYDVVFCCCSAVEPDEKAAEALRAYVSEGGTLYASDWRYGLVARAFPEMKPAPERPVGPGQTITGPDGVARPIVLPSTLASDGVIVTNKGMVGAEVLDEGLRAALESSAILLNFEMPYWKQAAFKGYKVNVLLRTRSQLYKLSGFDGASGDRGGGVLRKSQELASDKEAEIPLLVKFSIGKGTVIFTSYHHGKTNSDNEQRLLKYLIYKLVTSNVETTIEDVLEKNQFSPVKANLFSASKDSPAFTKSYHNPEAGRLRFDVLFEEAGAELKLEVRSPAGKKQETQGSKSVFIEVPDAEPGDWTYTVTALSVPYENFAFQTRVSHGKR
jgi:hypothetical protein